MEEGEGRGGERGGEGRGEGRGGEGRGGEGRRGGMINASRKRDSTQLGDSVKVCL